MPLARAPKSPRSRTLTRDLSLRSRSLAARPASPGTAPPLAAAPKVVRFTVAPSGERGLLRHQSTLGVARALETAERSVLVLSLGEVAVHLGVSRSELTSTQDKLQCVVTRSSTSAT